MRSRRLLAFLFGLSLASSSNASERCAVLFQTPDGQIEHKELATLSLANLAPEAQFTLPHEAPENVKSVQCGRSTLVPGPNDHKPLLAGYPLSIVSDGRVGVLEAVNGQLRFRMLEGEMSASESEQAQTTLNAAQDQFNVRAAVAP